MAVGLYNLAYIYRDQGQYAQAELYRATDRSKEAEKLEARAARIQSKNALSPECVEEAGVLIHRRIKVRYLLLHEIVR